MNKLDTMVVDWLQHLAGNIRDGKLEVEKFSIGSISDNGRMRLELEASPAPEKK